MLIDSVLGSLFQKRYRLNNGQMAEFVIAGQAAEKEKGLDWMSNDMVNLLSNLLVTGMAIAGWLLL